MGQKKVQINTVLIDKDEIVSTNMKEIHFKSLIYKMYTVRKIICKYFLSSLCFKDLERRLIMPCWLNNVGEW